MDIDQGEDYTSDIIYTDDMDSPYNVIAPCRLDIKSQTGTRSDRGLTTPDTALPDGEILGDHPVLGGGADPAATSRTR